MTPKRDQTGPIKMPFGQDCHTWSVCHIFGKCPKTNWSTLIPLSTGFRHKKCKSASTKSHDIFLTCFGLNVKQALLAPKRWLTEKIDKLVTHVWKTLLCHYTLYFKLAWTRIAQETRFLSDKKKPCWTSNLTGLTSFMLVFLRPQIRSDATFLFTEAELIKNGLWNESLSHGFSPTWINATLSLCREERYSLSALQTPTHLEKNSFFNRSDVVLKP